MTGKKGQRHYTVEESTQVFEMRANGFTKKQIAKHLGRTFYSIRQHLDRPQRSVMTVRQACEHFCKIEPLSTRELAAHVSSILKRDVSEGAINSTLRYADTLKRRVDGKIEYSI